MRIPTSELVARISVTTTATGSPVVVWYSEELPRARGVPHVLSCTRGCTG